MRNRNFRNVLEACFHKHLWSFDFIACLHVTEKNEVFRSATYKDAKWRWRDSNSWPPACKAGALPTELHPHGCGSPSFKAIPYSFIFTPFGVMGLSGLEPPTSRLSGVRSNRLSYKPIESGIHLLSHAVSSIVPSADQVLTVVFGMGTGVSHERIDTRNI